MDDCISRRATIDAVRKNTFRLTFAEEQNCEGHVAWSAEAVYSDVMEGALLELPSAQPERKTGRWVNIDESEKWECSECGRMMWFSQRLGVKPSDYSFCPNCGAAMMEEA